MINIATIGTSWITDEFIDAIKKTKKYNLTAVYSRSLDKAMSFAKKHGAPLYFDDLNALAECDKVDAVYIASPNKLHFEQSMLMLKHKKHVICEKPVTTSGKLIQKLLDTAKENNVIFMEAIVSLHTPMMKTLESTLEKIGNINFARFEYCQLSSKYNALKNGELPNVFNPELQGGSLMDLGIYCIYPAIFLFGDCQNIKALSYKHSNGIDLCGSAILEYDDKIVVINNSKIGNGKSNSEIIGDNGSVTIEMVSRLSKIILHKNGSEKQEIIAKAKEDINPMTYEAESFYNYITDIQNYRKEYEEISDLCIKVSNTLEKIRKEYKLDF